MVNFQPQQITLEEWSKTAVRLVTAAADRSIGPPIVARNANSRLGIHPPFMKRRMHWITGPKG
jgi:hypothetical protein